VTDAECRPAQGRVHIFIDDGQFEVAVASTAVDGRFQVRASPNAAVFEQALADGRLDVDASVTGSDGKEGGSWSFSRIVRNGRWLAADGEAPQPVTIILGTGPAPC
jgi:hypothetical protein